MEDVIELIPIRDKGCFDYFLVILASDKIIYTKDGRKISRVEIANTAFGRVKVFFNEGYYCIDGLTL